MGWASGSGIAIDMIEEIVDSVKSTAIRKRLYKVLYNTLRQEDWDTVDEAMGIDPIFDQVVAEIDGDADEDEES